MEISEAVREIGDWHVDTFGDAVALKKMKIKLLEEASEVHGAKKKELPHELADVFIVLCSICHRRGISLEDAFRQKFNIVKGRYEGEERVQ